MIIPDEEEQNRKLSLIQDASRALVNHDVPALPPPARSGPTSYNAVIPTYDASQALHGRSARAVNKRRTDRRFWKASLYAVLIYGLISVAVVVVIFKGAKALKWHATATVLPWSSRGRTTSPPDFSSSQLFEFPLTDPSANCNPWQNFEAGNLKYSSSFQAGLSATALEIRSNVSDQRTGPQIVLGNITVAVSAEENILETGLWIRMQSNNLDLQQRTVVCLQEAEDSVAVNIFVPDNLDPSDSLIFDIDLIFPQAAPLLVMKRLVTYLPSFTQKLGNLVPHVTFKTVILEGLSSPVAVDSLRAEEIVVKSSYAEIAGTFNVSKSIVLDTVGAPINADIILFHDGKRRGATHLSLNTGNSAVNAGITLLAPAVSSLSLSKKVPSYITQVKTFNGPLNLKIAHAESTPLSSFHLRASNSLAPSNVTLDSKYQGSFDIQTKLSSALVDQNLAQTSMYGHSWSCIFDHVSSDRSLGWVGWGERPRSWESARQGHIEISSSLSPVYLQFDQRTDDKSDI